MFITALSIAVITQGEPSGKSSRFKTVQKSTLVFHTIPALFRVIRVIYPNPVSDYLTISELDRRVHKVVITNAAGLTLRTILVDRDKTCIDASGLRPGLYLITGYDKKGNPFPGLKFAKD